MIPEFQWAGGREYLWQRKTLTAPNYISFFNIPISAAIRVVGMLRSTRAGFTNTGAKYIVNGDNTLNTYQYNVLLFQGAANLSGAVAGDRSGYLAQIEAANAAAGLFTPVEMFMPGADDPGAKKNIASRGASYNAGSSMTGTLAGNTSPIGALQYLDVFDDVAGNLATGSYLEVWLTAR